MALKFRFSMFEMLALGKVIADDDSADRLSHRVTTAILILSAGLVAAKQYVGDPITCWVPAHFTGNHEKYAESYCWIRNTYYLPWATNIPQKHEEGEHYVVTYYQWMPMILCAQALFCYMPKRMWTMMNTRSGMDISRIMEKAEDLQNAQKGEEHEAAKTEIASHMHRALVRNKSSSSKVTISLNVILTRICCNVFGQNKGNYLIIIFLITKLFYIANLFGQMFLLQYVLGFNFSNYGIEVIQSLYGGEEWVNTPFPRVTMCDMDIRRLGNIHRYAIQCVLPINLYTEKLYLFQWFWFVLLLAISIMEIFQWVFRILLGKKIREGYITKYLNFVQKNFNEVEDEESEEDPKKINESEDNNENKGKASAVADEKGRIYILNEGHAKKFCNDYLKQDGVFVLRLIAKNSTQSVACFIIKELFVKFYPLYLEKKRQEEEDNIHDPPYKYENAPTLRMRDKKGESTV